LSVVGSTLEARARRHAALGDAARLAIVDELVTADRTSLELQQHFGMASNHIAYHLDVLERAGLVTRCQSSGDGRRRYVCLRREAVPETLVQASVAPQPALFICTRNSARSQLAAALWRDLTATAATSAGTHPADRIHPAAVAAGRRAGVDLRDAHPRWLGDVRALPGFVVTVCDRAHEEIGPEPDWLHWSLPDPVTVGTATAFDATVRRLRERITTLVGEAA
jgi:ArsR family transcriptional regulator, arsenate/arsenite/antimonite-responsive transcriptional repressor / arsenate reductase (thioredoxin)